MREVGNPIRVLGNAMVKMAWRSCRATDCEFHRNSRTVRDAGEKLEADTGRCRDCPLDDVDELALRLRIARPDLPVG